VQHEEEIDRAQRQAERHDHHHGADDLLDPDA
jgi:hypothetical protein